MAFNVCVNVTCLCALSFQIDFALFAFIELFASVLLFKASPSCSTQKKIDQSISRITKLENFQHINMLAD